MPDGQFEPIRVLVSERSRSVRTGIRESFARSRDCAVVGELDTVAGLAEMSVSVLPDVILLGAERVDQTSIALGDTLQQLPHARVIVLIASDSGEDVVEAIRAGARGLFLRFTDPGVLLRACHEVVAGGCAIDPRLARTLFDQLAADTRGPIAARHVEASVLDRLSPREQEILVALLGGAGLDVLARTLHISRGTLKTHCRRIYAKLGVHTRAEATALAMNGSRVSAA